MKLAFIAKAGTAVLDKLGPVTATLAKKTPEIMMGSGIALLVGSNVLSGWATLKAKDVMASEVESEDPEDARKETIVKTAKAIGYYTPAIAATGIGIALIVKGNGVQNARIASAAAAYSALSTSFELYRKRVVEDQGAAADVKYYYGEKPQKADIYYEPEEEGKKPKKHREEVVVRDKMSGSPYAAIFDDVSADWTDNREQNLYFLKCQQVVANQKLVRRGYLFLSEVLEMLGLPYNPAGQFVGWIDEAYEGSVDGIVDFGIDMAFLEEELDKAQAEGRNPEPSIWLDFNVDGEIWDKIPLVKKQMR